MRLRRTTGLTVAGLAMLGMAACGNSDQASTGSQPTTPMSTTSTTSAPMTTQQFGPACAGVPKDGAGSFAGMAKDPVATAASNNPALSTLVAAVQQALTKILTYHVVGKTVTPADLGSGSFETLEKGTVTTSGSGMSYKVNDANVVCGNVKTANATVYIIDSVLMPMCRMAFGAPAARQAPKAMACGPAGSAGRRVCAGPGRSAGRSSRAARSTGPDRPRNASA
jgi:uncharacterized surface protein with fasciclin (FAS1) repeats